MGILEGIRTGVQENKRLKQIQGVQLAPTVNAQNQGTRPADYKPTTSRTDVDPAMYAYLQGQVDRGNITKEEQNRRINGANGVQVGPDGRQTIMATFEDPRYAGQPNTPSMRDQTATAATTALGQQGPRNALNYMREAPTVDPGLNVMRQGQQIDQSGVTGAQMLGLQDRNSQADALSMQRMAAMGQQPSVAAIQQQQGLDAALSGQFALANSARGGAAQRGAAQGMAQQQAGQMQQAAVNQAAALRAGEMAQARGAYGDLSGAMRAGDLGQADLAGRMGVSQAQLLQEQQLANQGLVGEAQNLNARLQLDQQLANQQGIMGQTQMDDARALGLIQATQNADATDLQAQQAQEQARLQLLGMKTGVALSQQARGDRMMGGAMQTAGQVMSFIPGLQGAGKALSSAGG